jgi:hypothetical protein
VRCFGAARVFFKVAQGAGEVDAEAGEGRTGLEGGAVGAKDLEAVGLAYNLKCCVLGTTPSPTPFKHLFATTEWSQRIHRHQTHALRLTNRSKAEGL